MIEMHLLDDDRTVLHSPTNPDIRLTQLMGSRKINEIPTLSFKLAEGDDRNVFIQLKKTKLRVVDKTTGEELFEGRAYDYSAPLGEGDNSTTYLAEDALAYLRDSKQKEYTFEGRPSALLKRVLDRHNAQASEDTKFEIGVCEIDMYKFYPDGTEVEGEGGTINVPLTVNSTVTIKPNAQYIYAAYGGTRLRMADWIKGKQVTISHKQEVQGAMYYTIRQGGVTQGIVAGGEIVEGYSTATQGAGIPSTSTNGGWPQHTVVKIKPAVTRWYMTYASNGPSSTIPANRKNLHYTIGPYYAATNRYPLYLNGQGTAWIGKDALDVISYPISPTNPKTNTGYVEKPRTIKCDIREGESSWDVILRELLKDGEIERTKNEVGKNVINIREDKGPNTNTPIELALNIIDMVESLDASDIVTTLIPIGNPPRVEGATQGDPIRIDGEYVKSEELLRLFDPNVLLMTFNDVTSKTDLTKKAEDWLAEQLERNIETIVTAMDLKYLGYDYDAINEGDYVRVTTKPYLLSNGSMRVIKKTPNYLEPWKAEYTLGTEKRKLSDILKGRV